MKAITAVLAAMVLLFASSASEARLIKVKMDSTFVYTWDDYWLMSITNAKIGDWVTVGTWPVFLNMRTSAGDTIIAIQKVTGYNGILDLRGEDTWLFPGTTILTNAEVRVYGKAVFGDPTGQDTRPVRIIASGLRSNVKTDEDAGLKVYGYLEAHRLEVEGFNNPPNGRPNTEGTGTAIIVQHGGWADLYECRTKGNICGLMVPSWGDAPSGTISTARTYRCSFEDSYSSLDFTPENRGKYYDEYSQFTKDVSVGVSGESPISPDSLWFFSATFIGSRLSTEIFYASTLPRDKVISISPSADFNDDGGINFADFIAFVRVFGSQASGETAKFDLSRNGTVDFSDFLLFVKQFGKLTKPAVALTKPVPVSPEQIQEAREFLANHPGWMPLLPLELQTLLAGAEQVGEFNLFQNFPNPFNATTTISYSLPIEADARLTIFGLTGQMVKTLVSGPQSSGHYTVRWDGTDDFGRPVASGVYFYQLLSGGYGDTHRMLLLK